jgi:iron complex transport system ATP-binding protein
VITFENLKIGHHQALANIRIQSLTSGNMYALIGSNGSGKSTFLKTICGQQKPFEGHLTINGKVVTEMSRLELSKCIAFVPSRFPETDFVTVFDFIALGRTPYLSNFGNLSETDRQLVHAIIEKVKITHLTNKFTNELSDGERQLCSVARALAQQTPIILLDEPTGYLDYRNKRRLLTILQELTVEMSLLTLLSTHDIETIQQLSVPLIGIEAQSDSKELPSLEFIDKEVSFETMINRYYR